MPDKRAKLITPELLRRMPLPEPDACGDKEARELTAEIPKVMHALSNSEEERTR